MDLNTLEKICARALDHTFCKKKLLVCALSLCICGIFVIFSMGLSLSASAWVSQSLSFLPLFISAFFLASLGIILIRSYHNEIKNRQVPYTKLFVESLTPVLSTMYCFIPIVTGYLMLWVALGLFFLLREIPLFGDFFGVVFAFGPFLLHLGSLLLLILTYFFLFSLTPLFALRSFQIQRLVPLVSGITKESLFTRILLMFLASIPFVSMSTLLWISAKMTSFVYFVQESHLQMILQWFFILPPFALFLAFPVIFFFNMAAEAHIVIQKQSTSALT